MTIRAAILGAALLAGILAASLQAQSTAGKQPAFDVASVKPNKSNDQPNSNFPLGPGDVYIPNGGFFSATNQPLIAYISFAYKLLGNQLQYLQPQLPGWVASDRFDIQARASGNPGKDEMRMMMRSLLAERFKFAIHYETRQVPVFALVLVKTGKTGPQLRLHPNDASCSTTASPPPGPPPTVAGGLPALCNGIYPMPPSALGRMHFAGRNVTIGFIGDTLSAGVGLGRPMIDETGLGGPVDFSLEFTPEPRGGRPPDPDSSLDTSFLDFQAALREQLGLTLQSKKSPFQVMVVDHIEHPTAN